VLLLLVPVAIVSLLFLPNDAANSAFSSTSSQERATGWAENFHGIVAHPFGAGIGTTGAAAGKAQELQGLTVQYFQPDNYYFAIAYELGVLGLWWHLLRMAYTFLAVRGASRVLAGQDAALASGVCAFVVASIFVSIIANFFGIYPVDPLWWVLIGVIATCAADATVSAAEQRVGVSAGAAL
jgi:hypothetical protein